MKVTVFNGSHNRIIVPEAGVMIAPEKSAIVDISQAAVDKLMGIRGLRVEQAARRPRADE